uniref:Uncharacterized protein n=1 Tax=Lutzomyia longipalpis TaxID=7200 RepID=A0A1B0CYC6_LUTLO
MASTVSSDVLWYSMNLKMISAGAQMPIRERLAMLADGLHVGSSEWRNYPHSVLFTSMSWQFLLPSPTPESTPVFAAMKKTNHETRETHLCGNSRKANNSKRF